MLRLAALSSALCILAVWGLYPAIIGLLASLRRGRSSASAPTSAAPRPRVTAVVATRADAASVRESGSRTCWRASIRPSSST
jgi:hypothetical protein